MLLLKNLFLVCFVLRTGADDPEIHLDVPGIIEYWGYEAEEHQVTTEDGYILTMHRIPNGRTPTKHNGQHKEVIFLQHGLEGDSSNWVTNLPWQSAGFIFADAGYDVWMGNLRGDTYSQQHTSLDPHKDPFWSFSYDEHAKYDIPSQLNYVLNHSRQSQLNYVGHSEGTMVGFVQFGQDPVLAAKIKRFFALAPVAYLGHVKGLVHFIAPFVNEIEMIFKLLGGYGEFVPEMQSALFRQISEWLCKHTVSDLLCENVLFLIGGADSKQLNDTRIPVYVAHSPAGTSSQNMVHFGQNAHTGNFDMYDYGSKQKNQDHYQQDTPPTYNPRNCKVPTYVFSGNMDILADPTDVAKLMPMLSNLKQHVQLVDFNHLDFIWGLNAAGQIYAPMLQMLKD